MIPKDHVQMCNEGLSMGNDLCGGCELEGHKLQSPGNTVFLYFLVNNLSLTL